MEYLIDPYRHWSGGGGGVCVPDPYYSGPDGDPYWANVELLLHADGANGSTGLLDSSHNAVLFTRVGSAAISTAQKKFGDGAAYLPDTSSGWEAANYAGVQFGTGDFTIEFWLRAASGSPGGEFMFLTCRDSSDSNRWYVTLDTSRFVTFGVDSSGLVSVHSSDVLAADTWTHFAISRSGTALRMFVNGHLSNSATDSTNFTHTSSLRVGTEPTFPGFRESYLDEIRITKGVARYTNNFTVPSAAYPDYLATGSLAHTVLLLHGETMADSSSEPKTVTPVGSAAVSTAQSKFGGSSYLFNGTTDRLTVPTNVDFDFGTGDFTIEAWVYITGNSPIGSGGTRNACIVGCTPAAVGYGFGLASDSVTTGTGLYFESKDGSAHTTDVAVPISQGAWHHCAVVRESLVCRLFLDGVLVRSASHTGLVDTWGHNVLVGMSSDAGSWVYPLNGYIDELRITKSVARYTADFTPATMAFCNGGGGPTPPPDPIPPTDPTEFTALVPRSYELRSSTFPIFTNRFVTFHMNGQVEIQTTGFGRTTSLEPWATPLTANGALGMEYLILEGSMTSGPAPVGWTTFSAPFTKSAPLVYSSVRETGVLVRFQVRKISEPSLIADYSITYEAYGGGGTSS